MGRIYQVFVIGMQGEKKTIDVANSEEEFNNTTVAELKQKLAEKLPQEASDEMDTKIDTAVPKKSLHLGSAVKTMKRRFSWPLSRESEAPSQTPSVDSTALQAGASVSVNQVEKDIKKMNIKDPVDRSLNERPTTEPRQTNRDPCSYRGLLNPGATCYLNATLQVLFMTPAFRDRVLLLSPSGTSEKLDSALKELFEELSKQDRADRSVSTKGVIQALGIERVYEQQDAVEYFLDILEKVGLDLAKVFRGTMRNHRRCSENHKSHDDSSFKSLQIALNSRDGTYTLEDGIQSYFASTKLVGDDQMYCEDCDEKRDTIWSCDIHEYPTILPLHLKRFVYDCWSCGFVKNDCPMDVPLHLSLRFQEQEQQYSLYAVINHRGSRHGGHYTAHIRSSEENKWYCFNDSRVTEVDESKLKASSEAYLLLYQKIARVEDVKEEPKMNTAEAGDAVEAGRAECGRAHNKPQLEDLYLQAKEHVSKLRKTVHQNHKDNRPYYVKKPRKIKHKKTHKRERARKRQLCSNHRETEREIYIN